MDGLVLRSGGKKCLLWNEKERTKQKTYTWMSVWWKTKIYKWRIYMSNIRWVPWGTCWPRLLTTCCVLTRCVVRKRSESWSTVQSCVFLAPEWAVHVPKWSPNASIWNFLYPQTASGFSVITGIGSPRDMGHWVAGQDSSLWWGLICLSQLMGL